MIHFINRIEDVPEYPNARVVLIDDSLQSEQDVIDRIEKALDAPYDKDNWDGFRDAVLDLQWLKEFSVVLIHKELPHLTARDLHIYLDILDEASSLWADKDHWLERHRALWCLVDEELAKPADSFNYIDFQVYFVVEDKPRIDFFLPERFPQSEVKAGKAPTVNIGDIFEIPLPWNQKRYMQFCFMDASQKGVCGVRVFKTDYSTEDKPSVDDIVRDSVDFYCSTYAIGQGVLYGLWTYYGKSTDVGDVNEIFFRSFDRKIPGLNHQRWRIWRPSQEAQYYRVLPRCFLNTDYGGLYAPIHIIDRIGRHRWFLDANVYDDYKGASWIERLLGKEHVPEHLAPKK